MKDHQAPDALQIEAIDWLVGRLRWEHVLRDLHDRAEGVEPVAPIVELPEQPADERAA